MMQLDNHNNHTWWHVITCAMLQQLNLIIIYDNYNRHIGLTWSTSIFQMVKMKIKPIQLRHKYVLLVKKYN
jgi:hypothetical protein